MGQTTRAISAAPELRPGGATWLEPRILLCRSPAVHTEPAVLAYYDAIRDAIAEGTEPYVIISDTRHIRSIPDGAVRRLHARLAAESVRDNPRRCLYAVTIIESAAMRAAYTVVMWLLGEETVPHESVGSFHEALRVARARL